MFDPTALGGNQVSALLAAIGRRAAMARYLPVLVLMLALGIAAMAAAIVWSGGVRPDLLVPIAAVTLLAMAALAAIVALRPLPPAIVARRVDFSLQLSEQLSTASGIKASTPSNAVLRSLYGGARRAASGIDVARAMPIYSRLLGLSFAALCLALGGAATAIGFAEYRAAPAQVIDAAEAPPAEESYSADDLDVLAKLIADDAERRNSDYLQALSKSISQLAEAARQGTPQPELKAELEALLEHAAAGYEGQMPDWMSNSAGDASSVLQNALAFSAARQQAAAERERLGGNGPRISSVDMYKTSEDRFTKSATSQAPAASKPMEGSVADREGSLENSSIGGGDFAATPMEDQAFESAGSLPVGAAAQSGKGESNIAGGGSQALAENTAFLETMADPTLAMSIASEETSDGSRIRMHVPTSAELADVAALGAVGGAGWDRQVAQSVSRQVITPQASAAVSRYFNRPALGQEP